MTHLLVRCALARPLVLVIDDLHQTDEGSLALLLALARNVRDVPIVLVATHRELLKESPSERFVELILREAGTQSLGLSGLERSSVADILDRTLASDVSSTLVERVYAATGGNPFFVSEVARLLAGRERSGALEHFSFSIPESLRAAVRGRLADVPAAYQDLLAAAAVAARAYTWRCCAAC